MAERLDAVILIEPLAGSTAYPLRTAADVLAVIDRGDGSTRLRLLADLYHLSVNGDDIARRHRCPHGSASGTCRIADAPGRGAPGTASLDILAGTCAGWHDRGYRGNVSLEYRADRPDPFGWLPRSRRGGPWQNPPKKVRAGGPVGPPALVSGNGIKISERSPGIVALRNRDQFFTNRRIGHCVDPRVEASPVVGALLCCRETARRTLFSLP